MRIRKKKWAAPELSECPFYTKEPDKYKGKWETVFPKNQPIHMEIGCGKGTFAGTLAKNNPNINYIALDIKEDMLGVARRNIVKIFDGDAIDNLFLVEKNCEMIDHAFSKEDNIQRMYINFCNPWPKDKHKKRRLTYPRKLMMYRDFLPDNCEIRFKTDDDNLFEESIEYFLLDTPYACAETIINREISKKLAKCSPSTLNVASKMIDILLEQQDSLSAE